MNFKKIDPAIINSAQLLLHHAVQFIAASGKCLLDEKDGDSHTNMS